jgi:hypothetical protein
VTAEYEGIVFHVEAQADRATGDDAVEVIQAVLLQSTGEEGRFGQLLQARLIERQLQAPAAKAHGDRHAVGFEFGRFEIQPHVIAKADLCHVQHLRLLTLENWTANAEIGVGK